MEENEELEEELILNDEKTSEVNEQQIVADNIFTNHLTQTEMIMLINRRVDIIKSGSPVYIVSTETNAHKLAILELIQGKCPLAIEKSRGFKNGKELIEICDVNQMIITKKCFSSISSIINLKDTCLDLKDELKKLLSGSDD